MIGLPTTLIIGFGIDFEYSRELLQQQQQQYTKARVASSYWEARGIEWNTSSYYYGHPTMAQKEVENASGNVKPIYRKLM